MGILSAVDALSFVQTEIKRQGFGASDPFEEEGFFITRIKAPNGAAIGSVSFPIRLGMDEGGAYPYLTELVKEALRAAVKEPVTKA